jgi:tetratricopeptide (TPR) repeat protein/TolB-like protein
VLSDLKLLQRSSGPSAVHSSFHSAVSAPAPARPRRKAGWLVLPAVAGAVVLALLLVFKPWTLEIQSTHEAEASADRLAVMYFDNLTDPDDAQRRGEVVSSLIISDLSESRQLQVVSSQRLYDLLKNLGREGTRKITPDVATEVARKANARWMLTGRILSAEPNWVVSAELSDVATGDLLASPSVTGASGERIFEVVDRLTSEIKRHMALPEGSLADVDKPVIELTTESSDAYRLYLEGKELENRFFIPEAEAKYREALTYDSTFAMAYYGIAGCRMAYWNDFLGARVAALAALRHVKHTSERDGQLIRGLAALVEGRDEEAISQYQNVIDKDPEDKEAWEQLGFIYQFFAPARDYRRAIEMYTQVIKIDPLYKNSYNSLAYAYDAVGDLEQSLWAINKYIELAPGEPNPYDSRAELLAKNGRLPEALDSYLQALNVKADYLPSLQGLIGLYCHAGLYDKAERLAASMVEHDLPDLQWRGLVSRAAIAMHQGKAKRALGLLAEAVDFAKATPALQNQVAAGYSGRAFLRAFLGDQKGAFEELKKAHEARLGSLNAKEADAWRLSEQVDVCSKFGPPAKADSILALLEPLVGLPNGPDSSSYWKLVSRSRFYRGDYDSAIVYIQQGGGEQMEFSELVWLGRAYAGKRQLRDAASYLERANAMFDINRRSSVVHSVMVHFWLGEVYEKSGRTQDAVREYRSFLDIWKDADPGIQEIADAQSRLAALQS